ncbi:unnamed protein product [Amoebophrya sp. A25]|nr:unnamed protein product [Amoebophrya sp. A25]|eukprot:GSA25T00020133001.1
MQNGKHEEDLPFRVPLDSLVDLLREHAPQIIMRKGSSFSSSTSRQQPAASSKKMLRVQATKVVKLAKRAILSSPRQPDEDAAASEVIAVLLQEIWDQMTKSGSFALVYAIEPFLLELISGVALADLSISGAASSTTAQQTSSVAYTWFSGKMHALVGYFDFHGKSKVRTLTQEGFFSSLYLAKLMLHFFPTTDVRHPLVSPMLVHLDRLAMGFRKLFQRADLKTQRAAAVFLRNVSFEYSNFSGSASGTTGGTEEDIMSTPVVPTTCSADSTAEDRSRYLPGFFVMESHVAELDAALRKQERAKKSLMVERKNTSLSSSPACLHPASVQSAASVTVPQVQKPVYLESTTAEDEDEDGENFEAMSSQQVSSTTSSTGFTSWCNSCPSWVRHVQPGRGSSGSSSKTQKKNTSTTSLGSTSSSSPSSKAKNVFEGRALFPLQYLKKPLVQIPVLDPVFHDPRDGALPKGDPNRSGARRLQREYQKERRNAGKELRRDGDFLRLHQAQQDARRDKRQAAERKRVRGIMGVEAQEIAKLKTENSTSMDTSIIDTAAKRRRKEKKMNPRLAGNKF